MKSQRKQAASGFALPALIFFLTAATILIAATVPVYQMQAKRAQEEELIFRGEEYMRAIQKFQRKYNTWPPTLDALVETNGLRFIRKPYTDPISGKPFRVISINPDGTVTGSTLFNPNSNNRGPFGQQSQAQQNLTTNQMAQAQNFSQSFQQTQNQQNQQRNQQQQQTKAGSTSQSGGAQSTTGSRQNQPGIPTPQTAGAAGIIGVAPDNAAESIKVYNGRQKYNEWEFIALVQQTQQMQQNQQNQQNQQQNQNPFSNPNQQNNQRPGTPNMPGFSQPNMPQPGFNQPGFPQPGQNQPGSPFGFGPQPQQQQTQPQPIRRPN